MMGMDLVTLRDETTSSSMTEHVFDDSSTSNKFDRRLLVLTQRRRLREISYDMKKIPWLLGDGDRNREQQEATH
jgi:hypothetical protein